MLAHLIHLEVSLDPRSRSAFVKATRSRSRSQVGYKILIGKPAHDAQRLLGRPDEDYGRALQYNVLCKARRGSLDVPEMPTEMSEQFTELGYSGPLRIFSALECQRFLHAISDSEIPPPLDWNKGHAASSHIFFEAGRHPAIVERVSTLIGDDVMLWGASMQDRAPGAIHPWHSDIESFALPGKTVSVWVGIENTTCDSSLQIVPYSQRFGVTVQQVRHELGIARDEPTDDDIVSWAQARDQRSHLLKLDMTDGEAVFLDGQLWHGSRNLFTETRRALLLQYATPDAAIRIPDLNYLDWPFRQFSLPRPACVMINGSTKGDINRIVSPPPMANNIEGSVHLTSRIYPLQLPLEPDKIAGWKPYFLFNGATPELAAIACHVSVLKPGHCPHPPHTHNEEELLLLLSGEVDLILPNTPGGEAVQHRRLTAGQFVYYPLDFPHTLETVSEQPANYLMFKWQNHSRDAGSHLAFGQFNIFERQNGSSVQPGFSTELKFEGSTAYLRKLHCHTSTLTPSAGYEPHIDSHDVGIILLEGEVEILGERVGPYSVIFCPAGEPHGIRNPGETVAKYIVFEFHGNQTTLGDEDIPPAPPPVANITEGPGRQRKLKGLLKALLRKV